jgi:hypothetical protein
MVMPIRYRIIILIALFIAFVMIDITFAFSDQVKPGLNASSGKINEGNVNVNPVGKINEGNVNVNPVGKINEGNVNVNPVGNINPEIEKIKGYKNNMAKTFECNKRGKDNC